MGRRAKYTPEEREAKKKESKQKFNAKVKNDPILHEKEKAQKRISQAKRIANMTPEEREADKEYNRIKKQESRAKKALRQQVVCLLSAVLEKKIKESINFQRAMRVGQANQHQEQVSCEVTEQI